MLQGLRREQHGEAGKGSRQGSYKAISGSHGYREDRGRVAAVGDTDHLAHPSQKSASPSSRRFLWGTVGPHVPWGGHTDRPSPREKLGCVMRTRTRTPRGPHAGSTAMLVLPAETLLSFAGRPTALGDTAGHRGDPCGASVGVVVGMQQTSI